MVQMQPELKEKMFVTTVQHLDARFCLLKACVMMRIYCLEISRWASQHSDHIYHEFHYTHTVKVVPSQLFLV